MSQYEFIYLQVSGIAIPVTAVTAAFLSPGSTSTFSIRTAATAICFSGRSSVPAASCQTDGVGIIVGIMVWWREVGV